MSAATLASPTPIQQRFTTLRQQERCALMPFLMAGDPDPATTGAALLALQAAGATPGTVLELLTQLRGELTIPVVLFTYSNPLLNRGMEAFCRAAAAAGAAGLVVPDLPLEEAEKLSAIAAAEALDLVLLVAPTTPADRMGRIAAASRGFTYLVSVTGVTGVRTSIETRVEGLVQQLKGMGPTPVAVGFGIAGPDQARQVRDWGADGAIVGSALVKVMAEACAQQQDVAAAAGAFCTELRRALDA